jgi:GntR family transcriptional regulator
VPVKVWHVDLRRDSPVPLYRQIADLLRADIENGTYQPGSMIPSLKSIEQDTGCTAKTIQRGIGILEEEGLVLIVPGKGTFVAGRSQ